MTSRCPRREDGPECYRPGAAYRPRRRPGGRLLAFFSANDPRDVHPDFWEVHPEGDELLILCSGALDLELEGPDDAHTVSLSPATACIVPAGVWHRLLLRKPSTLIAITHRDGTKHRPIKHG